MSVKMRRGPGRAPKDSYWDDSIGWVKNTIKMRRGPGRAPKDSYWDDSIGWVKNTIKMRRGPGRAPKDSYWDDSIGWVKKVNKCKLVRYEIENMEVFYDIEKELKPNVLYIIYEEGMSYGIYGRTNNIHRRYCQHLYPERECLQLINKPTIYLYSDNKLIIKNLETNIKRRLKENKHDHIYVKNERNNQVEFFPNENISDIIKLINLEIKRL